jgi:hypothetical protein
MLEGFWKKCYKKSCFAFFYKVVTFRLKTIRISVKILVSILRPTEQVIRNINASESVPKRDDTANLCWKIIFCTTGGF